jgi:4-hydroxybenzoate polyprenyltransferase
MKALRNFLELIKFEHTLFALPFAYLGMLLAARGWPTWPQVIGISVAMAAARTLAMAINRLADRHQDALNPRTAHRPLVTGAISTRAAMTGTIISGMILIAAAWSLGPLPLMLLPAAGLFLIGYSYTKRFTWLSHFILGATDGLAPVGAWVAVRGSLFTPADAPAWLLLLIVTLWIGGFDLIYACQDVGFDRQQALYSIPARFGIPAALRLSVICHLLSVAILAGLAAALGLHWPFWAAIGISAGLFVWEHRLVKPNDLSHLDLAFFNMNSYISLTLLAGIIGALLV